MSVRAILPFAAILLIAADEPAKETKQELDKLQGEWTMVSLEMMGKTSPDATVKQYKLTIEGDQWALTRGEGKASGTTFKIDPTKEPKTLDLISKTGAKETVSRGIYKLEGDTLTLCRTRGDAERPKEFKTTDNGGILVVWKRVKK